MTTEIEETQKVSDYQTLNDEDAAKVFNNVFADFKKLFPFQNMKLNEAIQLLLVVRQTLETKMCQSFGNIKDVHKKHAWLNQKMSDALKMNTIALLKQDADKKVKALKEAEDAAKLNDPIEEPCSEADSRKDNMRRFHVVPEKKKV